MTWQMVTLGAFLHKLNNFFKYLVQVKSTTKIFEHFVCRYITQSNLSCIATQHDWNIWCNFVTQLHWTNIFDRCNTTQLKHLVQFCDTTPLNKHLWPLQHNTIETFHISWLLMLASYFIFIKKKQEYIVS